MRNQPNCLLLSAIYFFYFLFKPRMQADRQRCCNHWNYRLLLEAVKTPPFFLTGFYFATTTQQFWTFVIESPHETSEYPFFNNKKNLILTLCEITTYNIFKLFKWYAFCHMALLSSICLSIRLVSVNLLNCSNVLLFEIKIYFCFLICYTLEAERLV